MHVWDREKADQRCQQTNCEEDWKAEIVNSQAEESDRCPSVQFLIGPLGLSLTPCGRDQENGQREKKGRE